MGRAEEKIRELARDLPPVRLIPPLRWALAAALALGPVALGAHWLLGGPALRPASGVVVGLPYLGTLAGLASISLGALGAALAGAVPGREGDARLGTRTAGLGLALILLSGLWGAANGRGGAGGSFVSSCVVRALVLGAAPALLACAFLLYAVLRRTGVEVALALAGGAALGAACVHTTCLSGNSLHWLVSHSLVPLAAALALAAPVAALLSLRTRGA